jgi:hypothetical protein
MCLHNEFAQWSCRCQRKSPEFVPDIIQIGDYRKRAVALTFFIFNSLLSIRLMRDWRQRVSRNYSSVQKRSLARGYFYTEGWA